MRSGPGAARTILLATLLSHIISARRSKQPLMVRTFLKVYMEHGSYFLFLPSKRHHHYMCTEVTNFAETHDELAAMVDCTHVRLVAFCRSNSAANAGCGASRSSCKVCRISTPIRVCHANDEVSLDI